MAAIAALVTGASLLLLLFYVVRARALRPSELRLQTLSESRSVQMRQEGSEFVLLRKPPSSIPFLARILNSGTYAQRWQFDIERAGLTLRVGEYFAIRLLAGGLGFVVPMLILRNGLGFLIAVVAAALCYMVPGYWLTSRVRRRKRAIEAQLVEATTLLASGLRAGFAFSQTVSVAAQRLGPPLETELNRMLLDINLGSSTEDALAAMNDRIGSDDLDMVVTAILIQRNTGGNLAEVIESVTETMRDRARVLAEIKTLTSQQRLTGWILSLWPIALGLIFLAINPHMMSLMWTTGPGIIMLVVWFIITSLAIFTYRRILDIDI